MAGERYHKEYCAGTLKYAIVFMMLILKGIMNTYRILFSLTIGIFNLSLTASWAEEVLSRLSRVEKIGQLIAARIESTYTQAELEQLINHYKVGALIPLQYWTLEEHDRYTSLNDTHPDIPLLIIEDAEWGINMHLPEMPAFPKAMTLTATHDTDLIYAVGSAIGMQCAALGIHINLAPVVDVNSDAANPVIGMRAFGDNTEPVTRYAGAYTQGLLDAGIVPCLKHFPGHGHTHTDPHLTLPIMMAPVDEAGKQELFCPFFDLINALPCSVLVGHIAYPSLEPDNAARPAITSHHLVSKLLAPRMQPQSLIISDALNMGALEAYNDPGEIALQALKAGIDILLCPPDTDAVINRITQALESGEYSDAELDKHVLKILQVKESLGLHGHNKPALPPLEQYEDLIQDAYDAAATRWNGFEPRHTQLLEPVTLGAPVTMHAPFYNPSQHYTKPLLIHLYPGSYKTHRLTVEQKDTLTQIATHYPGSIVLLFGSPYCLMDIPNALPTLVLYEDTPYTHITAQKVMRGTLMLQGALPITL